MSNTEGTTVLVTGRLVWLTGSTPFVGKPKLDQTTRVARTNKNGEPLIENGFGLAIPKSALGPGQQGEALWNAMHAETYKLYPSRQLPPAYAWKYKDGDGIDHNGQPFASREGHAEHLIFAMTTSLQIKFYRYENGNNILVNEGIKNGDYVQVQVSVVAHPPHGQGKAGLYLNPMAVQLIQPGKEIINTPSGDVIFGAPPAPPQGAVIGPASPPMPGYPQAAQGYPQPGNASLPHQPAPLPPQPQQPSPHYGVMPQAHQPPPGGQWAPSPAPAGAVAPPMAPPFAQSIATPAGNYPPPAGMPAYPGVRQ